MVLSLMCFFFKVYGETFSFVVSCHMVCGNEAATPLLPSFVPAVLQ